ncbi:unnamed protein product [[Candida] boidinii]|nr:unnamed protein product [[Candida] boidinii]
MPKKLTVSTLTTLLGHEHLNGIVNNSKSKIPHYPSSSQPPDIHIATPAPSPTLTSQHTGNSRSHSSNSAELDLGLNTKGRRLFNTNPHFPNIYPIYGGGYGDCDDGSVENNIPFSIREATSIFFDNIKDDIYNKQFTKTIQNFMEQELIDSENNDNFYKSNNIKDDEYKFVIKFKLNN